MTLRTLHRLSAIVIMLYAIIHITNHLIGVVSIEAHVAFMQGFRSIYRVPLFEGLLLVAVTFQIGSGITFILRGWKKIRGLVSWLQATSGAYLAFFLINHVGAIILGRTALNLDTNFYFAAAGFYVEPFQFFFAPYYFLAVLALFTHLGCALYWLLKASSLFLRGASITLPMAFGFIVALVIVLVLSGAFYPVEIPQEYKAIYEQFI